MASFSGWKRTALFLTILITTLSILLIILLFVSLFHLDKKDKSVYGKYRDPGGLEKDALGLSILYEGDCMVSAKMNLWIHLTVNIIGTCILATSNFFMQSLVAPVRAEVDAAHKTGYWLEIGVPSLRNFRFLRRRKIIYWSLFCLTSIPLQLIFNGIVIETKAANQGMIILGAEDLLKGDWYNLDPIYFMSMMRFLPEEDIQQHENRRQNPERDYTIMGNKAISDSLTAKETRGNWEFLSFQDCMKRYNSPDIDLTHYRHVIFVMYDYDDLNLTSTKGWKPSDIMKNTTNVPSPNETNPFWGSDYVRGPGTSETSIQSTGVYAFTQSLPGYSVDKDKKRPKWVSNTWNFEYTQNTFDPVSGLFIPDPRFFTTKHRALQVDHCLSERFTAPCQVSVANTLFLIVCVMCASKCALCYLVLKLKGNESPLMTPGDAIASFITRPDEETRGMCTLNSKDLDRTPTKKPQVIGDTTHNRKWLQGPRQWPVDTSTRRFQNAIPQTIWRLSFLLIGSSLIVAAVMLIIAVLGQPLSESQFSHTRKNSNVGSGGLNKLSLVPMTMVANLPQLILSICYITYNGLFTRMLAELEWTKYSIEYRALRVTEPKGEQNSTYRLQLPYRFSVPLIIISTLLHWIYSNCIYVSNYQDYDSIYPYEPRFRLGLQFSTTAILIGFCLSLVVAITPAFLVYIKLPGTMVIAGGNSAVISAACHYPSTKLKDITTSRSSRQYDSMSVRLMANQELEELEELEEVARKKLKWGVLITGNSEESLVGHLGFGTKDSDVGELIEGEYYSGL
ncbi:hypothetical protein FSHL1_006440 [Fusarium sambucinum]